MAVKKVHFTYKLTDTNEIQDTFYLSGCEKMDFKALKTTIMKLIPDCTYVHIKGKVKKISNERLEKVKQGGKYFEIPT